MITIVFILLWMVPAYIITYGLSFAYWQRRFPRLAAEDYKQDLYRATMLGIISMLFGPCSIPGSIVAFSGYGFKFK